MRLFPTTRHPDRVGVPAWLSVTLTISVGVASAVAGAAVFGARGTSASLGAVIGLALGLLLLWGLPSAPLRFSARISLVISGAAIARFANLSTGTTAGLEYVLAWIAAAVAALVLSDRVSTEQTPIAAEHRRTPIGSITAGLTGAAGAAGGAGATGAAGIAGAIGVPPRRPKRQASRTLGAAAALAVIALVVALLAVPFASRRFTAQSQAGSGPVIQGSGAAGLTSSNSMDMTRQPDLTDEIVLTVDADHPMFLRGDVYDQWDGRTWTMSHPIRRANGPTGAIRTGEDDLGARGPVETVQRIRVEAGYADLLLGAPAIVSIDSPTPMVQTDDGTVSAWPKPLGRGATYTVRSRSFDLTPQRLQAAGRWVPTDVARRYAAEPTTTDRVKALAQRIVDEAGATGNYDKVRALEAWMGRNLEYSIDAPTAPAGVDVVDDFLFRSKLGWCQQIASSLVVMARSLGIPARLATGYVATERDRATGDLVVRARNAHAWAEVWFADVGWVQFDPTADVPLAPQRDHRDTWADWLRDHALLLGIGLVVATAAVWAVLRLRRVVAARRHARPANDVARLDRRLDRLARRWGIERAPGDSASRLVERIERRSGGDELAPVAAVIDDHLFAPEPPSPSAVAGAVALLDKAEERAKRKPHP